MQEDLFRQPRSKVLGSPRTHEQSERGQLAEMFSGEPRGTSLTSANNLTVCNFFRVKLKCSTSLHTCKWRCVILGIHAVWRMKRDFYVRKHYITTAYLYMVKISLYLPGGHPQALHATELLPRSCLVPPWPSKQLTYRLIGSSRLNCLP